MNNFSIKLSKHAFIPIEEVLKFVELYEDKL